MLKRIVCAIGLHKIRPRWQKVPGMPAEELIGVCQYCGARFRPKPQKEW